jgi:hypothetical protein
MFPRAPRNIPSVARNLPGAADDAAPGFSLPQFLTLHDGDC